jgi:alpha-L-rhamnosidase
MKPLSPTDQPPPATICREAWLAEAERLTPRLCPREAARPVTVRLQRDPDSFQGWRTVEAPAYETLFTEGMTGGDGFVLDFGEHRVGFFHFTPVVVGEAADAPLRIKLVFGETPAEVAEPFDPYPGTISRAWLQDEIVNIDNPYGPIDLSRRYAFRYVRVSVLATSPWYRVRLRDIGCRCVTCADPERVPPLAANIAPQWQTLDAVSRRTLANCMQTVFEDGPKRDRRLWLGDLRLQALTNYVTFRNNDLVKRCLYLLAALSDADGHVPACIYETPAPFSSGTTILDYSALFGDVLLDYLQATGDRETATALWLVALRQLHFSLRYVSDRHLFEVPENEWIFIDWNLDLNHQAAMQGVLVYAIQRVIELGSLLGRSADTAGLADTAAALRDAARENLYDAATGLFVSGPEKQVSWASQAWMILSGIATPEAGARALRAVAAHPGALRPVTPYLYHHVVAAYFTCGLRAEAEAMLLDCWGRMIEQGATTFWEIYDPDEPFASPYKSHLVNSYCHAWSCTPSYFIRSETAAGGFRR